MISCTSLSPPSSSIIFRISFSACFCASGVPLIVTVRSWLPLRCLSMSMWAPVASRIALMLHPPRPISRDMRRELTYKRTLFRSLLLLRGLTFSHPPAAAAAEEAPPVIAAAAAASSLRREAEVRLLGEEEEDGDEVREVLASEVTYDGTELATRS